MKKGELGFFTRDAARKARTRKLAPRLPVDDEVYNNIGGEAASGMLNPNAESPCMEPIVADNPLVYVLGEAPGKQEDQRGEPFIGASGSLLKRQFPEDWEDFVCIDNTVRTRPPKNRTPTRVEIECFRADVTKTIVETKPEAILAVGMLATKWALGFSLLKRTPLKSLRGRRFPITVGGHQCWLYPIQHPAYILRLTGGGRGGKFAKDDKVPGNEWKRAFEADIRRMFQDLEDGLPPFPNPGPMPKCVLARTEKQLRKNLDAFDSDVALDLETNALRPYGKRAKILTCAISDGKRTVAFAVDHPLDKKPIPAARLRNIVREFLIGRRVVAHNLPFELEWLVGWLGEEILDTAQWEDSMGATYILDERLGVLSLGLMCQQEFGLQVKELERAGRFRYAMEEQDLDDTLRYNGVDAIWTIRLFHALMQRLMEQDLLAPYKCQVDRVPTIVLAQRYGVPVDPKETRALEREFSTTLAKVEKQLLGDPTVVRYLADGNAFSPTSVPNVIGLVKYLGFGEEISTSKDGKVKYSTDQELLSSLKHPVVDMVLKHRKYTKRLGTYVHRFLPDERQSYLWPDGKIHCQFKTMFTRTGRLSCAEPNQMNWPKRDAEARKVKRQMKAMEDYSFLAADFAQIEARVLAMHSEDPVWIKMVWDNYDVHLEWAKKVAKLCPKVLKAHQDSMKSLRTSIKNQLVFPAFYMAQADSIASYIGISDEAAEELFAEFWVTFAGIKEWQHRTWKAYRQQGYVESLMGRRRRAPLSQNMVANSPVQSDASDIVVDSMVRLSARARAEKRPWLQPLLNIHDELTFLVPNSELEEAIECVVEEMVAFDAPFVNVPLAVGVSIGTNLGEMEEIGEFSSAD